jgi:hypothetical protein
MMMMMMMTDGLVKCVAQSLVKLVVSMGPLLECYRVVGTVGPRNKTQDRNASKRVKL